MRGAKVRLLRARLILLRAWLALLIPWISAILPQTGGQALRVRGKLADRFRKWGKRMLVFSRDRHARPSCLLNVAALITVSLQAGVTFGQGDATDSKPSGQETPALTPILPSRQGSAKTLHPMSPKRSERKAYHLPPELVPDVDPAVAGVETREGLPPETRERFDRAYAALLQARKEVLQVQQDAWSRDPLLREADARMGNTRLGTRRDSAPDSRFKKVRDSWDKFAGAGGVSIQEFRAAYYTANDERICRQLLAEPALLPLLQWWAHRNIAVYPGSPIVSEDRLQRLLRERSLLNVRKELTKEQCLELLLAVARLQSEETADAYEQCRERLVSDAELDEVFLKKAVFDLEHEIFTTYLRENKPPEIGPADQRVSEAMAKCWEIWPLWHVAEAKAGQEALARRAEENRRISEARNANLGKANP